MSEFFKDDPMSQFSRQSQQESMNRTFQKYQQYGQYERMILSRLFRFSTLGIVVFLWKRSKPSLFLFLVPTWLYFFSMLGVVEALSSRMHHDSLGAIIGWAAFAAVCILLIGGSMWFGFQPTFGFGRVVAIAQMIVAGGFVLIGTYRAIVTPTAVSPYAPQSAECWIAILLMLVLFAASLLNDLVRAYLARRERQ